MLFRSIAGLTGSGTAWLLVMVISLAATAGAAQKPASAPGAGPQFLARHCLSCHGTEKQKGQVRFDDLKGDIVLEGTRWALALEQVRSGEMPPEEAKSQPSPAQRREFVELVTRQLGAHAPRKPNLGNLVPHEVLFGPEIGRAHV